MTVEEAIAILDSVLKPAQFNDLQALVFRQSWSGKTYQEIASEAGYDHDYIRGVGFQLWQVLSEAFGTKVTKHNFQSVLRQYAAHKAAQKNGESPSTTGGEQEKGSQAAVQPRKSSPLELPEGPVSLDSPFYIERPPIEGQCYAEIAKPGALIRIRAPSRKGKTSLKNRILAHAATLGYRTVRLNFEQADEAVLGNLNQFLRWFCANVSRQLGLEPKLEVYWDEDFGSKVSCTVYFQSYILEQIDSPLVLALDEVDRLFEYPTLAHNFLPLLRSWYEEAKDLEIWQKLRLIVVHSTENYIPLNIHQSPFNVGLLVRLPEFDLAQVKGLAQRHGLEWFGTGQAEQLMAMVGGHPYRVRLALYYLGQGEMTLEQLLQEAPTLVGIYSDRLRYQWATLQQHPELIAAMKQAIAAEASVRLEAIPAYKLESMGLVKLTGEGAIPSCELYRLYFRAQFE
jgi:hypothetical protein